MPAAKAINKEIVIYYPNSLNANQLISDYKGKTILIVGHSNTIPNLVNNVIKEKVYREIDERTYNDLFIVQIKNDKLRHQKIKVN